MSTAKTTGSRLRAALLAAVLIAACMGSPAIAADDAAPAKASSDKAAGSGSKASRAATDKITDKTTAGRAAQPRKAQGKATEQKTEKTGKATEQAKSAPPAHCAGLKGLPLEQCQQCDVPGKGDTMRFLCRQRVAAIYCVKNALKGDDPDCRANEPANRQNL